CRHPRRGDEHPGWATSAAGPFSRCGPVPGHRDHFPMSATRYQPQYRQIEQALRERIAILAPGQRLPPDAELCVEFGVSRMTARNAMERLTADGLIRREPGRGSFVAQPTPHRRTNRLMTFTQEMRRAGRTPSSRVLARVLRPSSATE